MKKQVLFWLLFMMALLLLVCEVQADGSLDFENGIEGFMRSGTCQIVQSPFSHGGSFSLGIEGRGSNDYDAADYSMKSLGIEAGAKVTLSFYAYHVGPGKGVIKAGLAGGSYAELARGEVEPFVWTKITGTFTVSELGIIRFQTYGANMNGVSFYVDDILVTVEKAQATAADTFVDYACGFEGGTGLDKWEARSAGAAKVVVDSNMAHQGSASLLITGRNDNWNSPGRSFVLTAGQSYNAACYVRQDSGRDVEFTLSAAITRNGQESYVNLARKIAKSGQWVELSAAMTTGAGVEDTVLYVETSNAPELSFWMDDFAVTKQGQSYRADLPSLKEIFEEDFLMGCAVGQSQTANGQRMALLLGQFNSFTPENELKPENVFDAKASRQLAQSGDNTHPAVRFDAVKPLLDFAMKNKAAVHGHVLVWHSQTPRSFFTVDYSEDGVLCPRETMLSRLENYIAAVMTYLDENYLGVVASWDVVNEAVLDGSGKLRGPKTQDEKNGTWWMDTVGEDYILQAFTLARKYAPQGTKLFYNDYSVPYEPKLTGIKAVMDQLTKAGVVDGIGFQGHYQLNSPTIKQIEDAMAYFAGQGLAIRVSELDITIPSNSDAAYLEQAKRYRSLMDLFQCYSKEIDAVTVWGTTDDLSWKSEQYPLLFDASMNPKPAYWAWADPSRLTLEKQEANAYGRVTDVKDNIRLATPYSFGGHAFRVLYDDRNLYVNLLVHDETVQANDSATVFAGGESVTMKRADGKEIQGGYEVSIPVPAASDSLTALDFDILVSDGQQHTAWNDKQNAEKDRQLGTLHLLKLANCASAIQGKPDITKDTIDPIWESAQSYTMTATRSDNADESGTVSASFRALWQPQMLYVLVTVKDPFLDDSNTSTYLQDSIEVFVDEGNHRTGAYEEDDGQYRVNFKNLLSVDQGEVLPVSRTFLTKEGFVVEIAIPLTEERASGHVLGFDVRYNNAASNGRRTLLNFYDDSDTGWSDTRVFGLLELK